MGFYVNMSLYELRRGVGGGGGGKYLQNRPVSLIYIAPKSKYICCNLAILIIQGLSRCGCILSIYIKHALEPYFYLFFDWSQQSTVSTDVYELIGIEMTYRHLTKSDTLIS